MSSSRAKGLSKLPTEGPHILRATVHYLVVTATWRPGFVHICTKPTLILYFDVCYLTCFKKSTTLTAESVASTQQFAANRHGEQVSSTT